MSNIDQWSRKKMYSLTLSLSLTCTRTHTLNHQGNRFIVCDVMLSDKNIRKHYEIWCNQIWNDTVRTHVRIIVKCSEKKIGNEKKGVVSTFWTETMPFFLFLEISFFLGRRGEKKDYVKIAKQQDRMKHHRFMSTYLYFNA